MVLQSFKITFFPFSYQIAFVIRHYFIAKTVNFFFFFCFVFLCSQHVTLLCVSHTLFAHSCVHILLDKCNLLASHSHLFSSIRDKEFGLKLGSGFRFDNESILKQGAASVARQE